MTPDCSTGVPQKVQECIQTVKSCPLLEPHKHISHVSCVEHSITSGARTHQNESVSPTACSTFLTKFFFFFLGRGCLGYNTAVWLECSRATRQPFCTKYVRAEWRTQTHQRLKLRPYSPVLVFVTALRHLTGAWTWSHSNTTLTFAEERLQCEHVCTPLSKFGKPRCFFSWQHTLSCLVAFL